MCSLSRRKSPRKLKGASEAGAERWLGLLQRLPQLCTGKIEKSSLGQDLSVKGSNSWKCRVSDRRVQLEGFPAHCQETFPLSHKDQPTESDTAVVQGGQATPHTGSRTWQHHPPGTGFVGMKYLRGRWSWKLVPRFQKATEVRLCGSITSPIRSPCRSLCKLRW